MIGQVITVISIDVLHDEVLLAIFDFYVDEAPIHAWQSLIHVCRRWRSVVFGSPCRLNLRLNCTSRTPTRDTLDVWPSLPIHIEDSDFVTQGLGNIVAALERSDRVRQIELWGLCSPMNEFLAATRAPFPELTDLLLEIYDENEAPVLPDSFLGGSTPRLKTLELERVSFPGLPKLLLSATYLVDLHLVEIPHSGYISPEVMVTALSTLTSLGSFKLEFESPRSHPRRPLPLRRTVLPALVEVSFKGDSRYLEDFVARIDAPQLTSLYIAFVDQIVSDPLQCIQFINRTPALKEFEKAAIVFGDLVRVNFSSQTSVLHMGIPCRRVPWQLLSLRRVFTSSLPPLSTSEDLFIYKKDMWLHTIDMPWLELFRPFTAVKNLYLSEKVVRYIAFSLEGLVGDKTTEVFPILQNIFLENIQLSRYDYEGIKRFAAARQATSHPVTVSHWDRDKMGCGEIDQ